MSLIVSSFKQVQQGVRYVRKFDEEVFLECAVVELVYNFNEKSYRECLKRWVNC